MKLHISIVLMICVFTTILPVLPALVLHLLIRFI
jgi:hypothetical protein